MKTRASLAIGLIGGLAVVSGCGVSRSTVVTAGPEIGVDGALVAAVAASEGPGLLSLGAGDQLGQQIHLFDVYLAALERMGPEPSPLMASSENLVAWVPAGYTITDDVSTWAPFWE